MRTHFGLLLGLALSSFTHAKLVFEDDFEGDLSKWKIQSCPNRVVIADDIVRTGSKSAKLTAGDDDTQENCKDSPTENPRAQLVGPELFKDGDEYYVAFSVYFPESFPRNISSWFMVAEIYGPPYAGHPGIALYATGNKLSWDRDESYGKDTPWTGADIMPGKWRDIILHVKWSTNADEGFVEIWDNGKPQQLTGGSNGGKKLYMRTLYPGVYWDGTPNSLILNQYRNKDVGYGDVTIHFDSVKIGTSFDDVAIRGKR